MKPLHIGLLVIGAALAGGLAVRMTDPPPLPQPSRVHAAAPSPTPVAAPSAVAAPLPPVQPAVIAPAPPPIYSEPSHVEFAKAIRPTVAPVPYQAPPVIAEPPHVTAPPQITAPAPRQVALLPGASVTIRLAETLSTERVVSGDTFQATLADPLVVDGLIVAERGARVTGRVSDARRAGRMSGVSSLELRLLDLTTADGQRIAVSCDPWFKHGDSMSQDAKSVTIPGETVIRFRLASRVTITERRL